MADAVQYSIHESKGGFVYLLDQVSGKMWVVKVEIGPRDTRSMASHYLVPVPFKDNVAKS